MSSILNWPCKVISKPSDSVAGAMDGTADYGYGEPISQAQLEKIKVRERRLIHADSGFPVRTIFLHLMEVGPGGGTLLHRHNCEEVFYFLEGGEGYLEIEGEKFPFEQGDAVYVPPNTKHRVVNEDPDKTIRYTVSGGVMLHPLPSSPVEAEKYGAHDVLYPEE